MIVRLIANPTPAIEREVVCANEAFEQLARELAAGDEKGSDDFGPIIAAAGKTFSELSYRVMAMQRTRRISGSNQ